MNTIKRFIAPPWLLVFATLVVAADNPPAPPNEAELDQAVANTTRDVILPSVANFARAAETLTEASRSFCNKPNEAALIQTQTRWRETMSAWQHVVVYRFGPMKEGFPVSLEWQIDSHLMPGGKRLAEIRKAIQRTLKSKADIDDVYILKQKVFARGLPALEHLLFENLAEETGVQAVLADYLGPNGSRKCAYLQAMAVNLDQLADTLNRAWHAEDNDYINKFIRVDPDNPDAGREAADELINKSIALLESIKRHKLDDVLGEGGEAANPLQAESNLSGVALDNIRANLESIAALFQAQSGSGDEYGFDDALATAGNGQAVEQFRSQLAATLKALDAIDVPLGEAVTTESDKVAALSGETSKLLQLFRLDLTDALGVTPEFNETDGD